MDKQLFANIATKSLGFQDSKFNVNAEDIEKTATVGAFGKDTRS